MPALLSKSNAAPAGYELIRRELDELKATMDAAMARPHEGMRLAESTWEIYRVAWQRSRLIWEAHKKGIINDSVVRYCVEEGLANSSLMKLWDIPGFEYVCCTASVDTSARNYGTTSICRVPLAERDSLRKTAPCQISGCVSCASHEASKFGHPIWWDTPRPYDLIGWAIAGCPMGDAEDSDEG